LKIFLFIAITKNSLVRICYLANFLVHNFL
jgi:hypothetical protein